jgi:hypothetical protein
LFNKPVNKINNILSGKYNSRTKSGANKIASNKLKSLSEKTHGSQNKGFQQAFKIYYSVEYAHPHKKGLRGILIVQSIALTNITEAIKQICSAFNVCQKF